MFFPVGSSNGEKSESVVEVVVFAVLWADTVQWLAGVRVLGFVSHFCTGFHGISTRNLSFLVIPAEDLECCRIGFGRTS